MKPVTNVIICGTGGQGILLASEILCEAARLADNDVKKSEVHGMAQRGGSVSSHVRFGEKVYSPLVEKGTADIILSMEKMEALRWAPFLRPAGTLLSCDLKITPMTVNTGHAVYPDVISMMHEQDIKCRMIPALEIAEELENLRVVNVVLMGAASPFIPIKEDYWYRAVEDRVPVKALDVNMEAFRKGRSLSE